MADSEKLITLDQAKTWSKVSIENLGLLDTEPKDLEMLGKEVVVLGEAEAADTFVLDPNSGKPIRTILTFLDGETWRLGGDILVKETFPARPAGHPQTLSRTAQSGTIIRSSNEGVIQFQNETPDFIWEQVDLYSAVNGLVDPEIAVEEIIYSISVAPIDVAPILFAALAQRFSELEELSESNRIPMPKWDSEGFKQA